MQYYACKIGYNSVQAASRTASSSAKSKEFCKKAFEAGMRYAYLQFDGIGNDANGHRQVGNLFDVKLRAIENMHEAGIEIVLVTTIVNNVNNDQVGPIVKFAMDNPKKISFVSFQPVSFTGRDEDITPERRIRQRYTLSHLAKDVSEQVGKIEPTRDWFPISYIATFAGFSDLSHGPDSQWGSLSCGCHPNCGVGTALMINKNTKEWSAGSAASSMHRQLTKDVTAITDAARGKEVFETSRDGDGDSERLPAFPGAAEPAAERPVDEGHLTRPGALLEARRRQESTERRNPERTYEDAMKRRNEDPWNFLFIAGVCGSRICSTTRFHAALEMCIIPYATQQGEQLFLLRVQHRRWLAEDYRGTCTRMRPSLSGTRSTASMRFTRRARKLT